MCERNCRVRPLNLLPTAVRQPSAKVVCLHRLARFLVFMVTKIVTVRKELKGDICCGSSIIVCFHRLALAAYANVCGLFDVCGA